MTPANEFAERQPCVSPSSYRSGPSRGKQYAVGAVARLGLPWPAGPEDNTGGAGANRQTRRCSMQENVLQSIGRTPLVRLRRVVEGLQASIYVKMESHNPGGSVKDRVGLAMILEAE